VLIGIVILLAILVNLTPVQNLLAQKAVAILSGKLQTKVSLKKVKISFFNEVQLEGLYVEDRQKDTLLYAGRAALRITDWFFLKDKPVLSYLGLNDAYVNLYRTRRSDTWNYQFVIDAFASKPSKKEKKGSDLKIDLRKVELNRVKFRMIDAWAGSDMEGAVDHFAIDARVVDFDKKEIDIASIGGNKVMFGLRDYKGGRPPHPKSTTVPAVDTTPFNPGKWKVRVSRLALEDSRFFLEDPDTKAVPGYFDPYHMNVTSIDIRSEDIRIIGDTLTGNLKHLGAKERCGFEIKELSAKVTVSPVLSECRDLKLVTGNSNLGNYYAMKYRRFPDFEDYINSVIMVGRLDQSEVGIADIAFFAPELKRYDKLSVLVSGSSTGPVSNLRVTGLRLDDGITKFSGNLSMQGLPNIDATYIKYTNGLIQTNGMAAYTYAPELRGQDALDLTDVKNLQFKGEFAGFISNFYTKGIINSNIGNLTADVHMKLPYGRQSSYAGSITAAGFDIGLLLKQDILGPLDLDVAVDGRGFDANEASINVKGNVRSAMLYGYNYRNIKIDGLLASRKFDGSLVARDSNLLLDFNGKIDFSGEVPAFDMHAAVTYADLQALGVTQNNVKAQGTLTANFEGSNIDNFTGAAQLFGMHITQDSIPLRIDSVTLVSRNNGEDFKEILLSSNEISAKVSGQFSLIDLPQSAQLFLSYYLPEYVKRPSRVNEKQNLAFEISAGAPNDLIALFNKKIQVAPGAHFEGAMDMPRQQLSFTGAIPSVAFGNMRLNNIEVRSNGTYEALRIEAMANGWKAGNNDLASTIQFQASLAQDTAQFQLLATSPTSIGSAEINGTAYADRDSFFLRLLPSQFFLNSDKWQIPGNNRFVFSKDYVAVKDLVMESGIQRVEVNTGSDGGPNEVVTHVRNIDIAPFNRLLGLENLYLDGRIDGSFDVNHLLKDQKLTFDLTASNLRVNNDTLGEVRAAGNYDVATSLVTLEEGSGLSYKSSRAEVEGTYNLRKESNENIDANIRFNHAEMKWAEPFLAGYVHRLTGEVNGSISIKGNAATPVTVGSLELGDVGFIPDITGVHYNIPAATIQVTDSKFDLGSITVKDDDGNEGTLSGSVQHSRLSNFSFRMNMRSDNIKVVDLRDYQNANFYGDVKASVQLRLSGPANNLNLNIFATPQKNSHLFIPITSGTDMGQYNYIHFKQYGQAQSPIVHNPNKFNIRIDAVATPDLEATIILDPNTKEQIWAKGTGNIILEIPSEGDMRMNGNYVIDEGKYDYAFRQLTVLNYQRQFIINPNSVIKWNGDIANADLDVSAYTQVKARLYDLIINEVDRANLSQSELKDAQIMQMVSVNMNMKGSLDKPDLKFKIDLVENRSVGTYAYQKLQRINTDDKQLYTQVASLLLLEQFVPPEGINNTAATAGVINNMSELASATASSQFTNFANKLLGMEDLSVGVKYKYYTLAEGAGSPNFINRNEAGLNLKKNFLKNRLIVEVGGIYDWGRNSNTDVVGSFAGDFRVQYLLTEDGRIRFNVFRTSNYDALFSQLIGRQGVGVSYRRSFNGLLDFFKTQKSIMAEKERKMEEQRQSRMNNIIPPVTTDSSKAPVK